MRTYFSLTPGDLFSRKWLFWKSFDETRLEHLAAEAFSDVCRECETQVGEEDVKRIVAAVSEFAAFHRKAYLRKLIGMKPVRVAFFLDFARKDPRRFSAMIYVYYLACCPGTLLGEHTFDLRPGATDNGTTQEEQ